MKISLHQPTGGWSDFGQCAQHPLSLHMALYITKFNNWLDVYPLLNLFKNIFSAVPVIGAVHSPHFPVGNQWRTKTMESRSHRRSADTFNASPPCEPSGGVSNASRFVYLQHDSIGDISRFIPSNIYLIISFLLHELCAFLFLSRKHMSLVSTPP